MRVAAHLHVQWVEDEAVVLDPSTEELHYLNSTASVTLAVLSELGFDRGVEELRRRFSDADGFAEDFSALLEQFKEKGFLIDD